jgi:hypothetical protein
LLREALTVRVVDVCVIDGRVVDGWLRLLVDLGRHDGRSA